MWFGATCKEAIRQLGTLDALLYFIARALERLSRGHVRLVGYYLVAQPVSGKRLLPAGRGETIRVREVTAAEAESMAFPRPRDVIRRRFRQGAICLGAFSGATLVGFIWLASGPYEEDEVRCWFQPEPGRVAAWDFDVYVDPAFRIGPAFARLWDTANEFMRARGIRWTMSRISIFNAASVRAHKRLNARVMARATFLVLGGVQVALSSLRPFLHVGLPGRRGPIFVLKAPRTA